MKLFFLKTKLTFLLLGFFIKLSFCSLLPTSSKKRSLISIIGILIFFSLLISIFFFIITKKEVISTTLNLSKTKKIEVFSPSDTTKYDRKELTKIELEEKIKTTEKLLEKQPNSRDLLINLSNLKKIIKQDEEAKTLWKKAQLIDPNNNYFR